MFTKKRQKSRWLSDFNTDKAENLREVERKEGGARVASELTPLYLGVKILIALWGKTAPSVLKTIETQYNWTLPSHLTPIGDDGDAICMNRSVQVRPGGSIAMQGGSTCLCCHCWYVESYHVQVWHSEGMTAKPGSGSLDQQTWHAGYVGSLLPTVLRHELNPDIDSIQCSEFIYGNVDLYSSHKCSGSLGRSITEQGGNLPPEVVLCDWPLIKSWDPQILFIGRLSTSGEEWSRHM